MTKYSECIQIAREGAKRVSQDGYNKAVPVALVIREEALNYFLYYYRDSKNSSSSMFRFSSKISPVISLHLDVQ